MEIDMPMIKCPECGREISSYAPACPGCGVPQDIIKKLLAEMEKPQMHPEPTIEPGQEVKSDRQEILQRETVLKASRTRTTKNIHCVICKNEYMSDGTTVCPKCEYPALSLIRDKKRTKKGIKEYRKAAGIQDVDLKVGQFYKMGRYGGEEINWRVLAVEGGKALLISEKGLDAKAYNEKSEAVTWETCTLRKWLNSDFYNSAFENDEKEKIRTTIVTADKNPDCSTDPGNGTEDKIFLLSIQEVSKYFADYGDRQAYPTEYAKAKGAYGNKYCWWWLRSPGSYNSRAAIIGNNSWDDYKGHSVRNNVHCVRPAMWISLNQQDESEVSHKSVSMISKVVSEPISTAINKAKESTNVCRNSLGINKAVKVGQSCKMGHYGGEDIDWRVLAVEGGKALLISEKGLDAKPFHRKNSLVSKPWEGPTGGDWENSSLRRWLNTDFVNAAFSEYEKGKIVTTKVSADSNPEYYSWSMEKATRDQVFVLSILEAKKYFASDEDRKAYPSKCAKANGAQVDSNTKCCWWWLRTRGSSLTAVACVMFRGDIIMHGNLPNLDRGCVRPALWVNLL